MSHEPRSIAWSMAPPLLAGEDPAAHVPQSAETAGMSEGTDRLPAMAGGRNKATTGLPAWLVAANAETRAAAEESMRQRRPARQIHVWVHGSAFDYPGLILDWRREGAGWAARAVWMTGEGDFVSAWVDAESVTPVETEEGPHSR